MRLLLLLQLRLSLLALGLALRECVVCVFEALGLSPYSLMSLGVQLHPLLQRYSRHVAAECQVLHDVSGDVVDM